MLTYLPVAAVIAVGLMAAARIVALRRRGVRAVVNDRQRSLAEKIFEASTAFLLIFWVYLIIVYADGRGPRWLPDWLDRAIIDEPLLQWLGAALLAAGVVLYALALRAMGDSWRMGIDRPAHANPPPSKGGARGGISNSKSFRESSDIANDSREPLTQPLPSGERGPTATLITHGIFARSRNPIYFGFDLLFGGAFAIHGRVIFLLAAALLAVVLHVQIHREERFLAAAYGERFANYRRQVRRYL